MNRAHCTIRAAVAEDAQLLSELALRAKAYWGYADDFIELCRQVLTYTPQQIVSDDFYFFVAENDDRTVGFYALERLSQREVGLEALFVEPDYIGQGYGYALMEHAKAKVKSLGASVIIIQSDPNAERFYRAAGGILIGQRESVVSPGRYLPVFSISLERE